MKPSDQSVQHDLIGYVADALDADERLVFEARLVREPELREQVDALRRVLAPLDAWPAPEPAADAVEAIMKRVETTSPLEYVASSTSITPEASDRRARRPFISLNELLALAACIALLFGVFMPGMAAKRARQLQLACGNNMAQVFRGLGQYAADYDGQLPRVGAPQNWLENPNRRNLVPVLQLRLIPIGALYCPTSPESLANNKLAFAQPATFLHVSNVRIRFYSPQNLYGPVPNFSEPVNVPLLADPNPMIADGRINPDADRTMNSRAHGGKGQNVLFLDGSVKFMRSPVLAGTRDNIWQVENVQNLTGAEAQESATDAFLIP